jgi:CheY-like chemotaxis protein
MGFMPAPLASPHIGQLPLALLVDGDRDTRTLYSEYLLRLSVCNSDEAADGREALAKAITGHPDVVVTETRLPGMNGFDLCRLLREDASTRTIPIVFVTGYAFEADVKRAAAAGADAVLVKPCLPEQLAGEICRLLRESDELRERARAVRDKVAVQLNRSAQLLDRSREVSRRTMLSRAYNRRDTTDPPNPPPALDCPACDQLLQYTRSHIGGVNERNAEQWDYFECAAGCGTFQYRQRTRKLRRVM